MAENQYKVYLYTRLNRVYLYYNVFFVYNLSHFLGVLKFRYLLYPDRKVLDIRTFVCKSNWFNFNSNVRLNLESTLYSGFRNYTL